MIYAITSLVIFTLYIGFILAKYGLLKSVSASYYALHDKALFSASLLVFSLSAMFAVESLLMFIAGSGICFVAFAPQYKIKFIGDVHYMAATLGIVFGFAQLAVWGYWPLVVPMLISLLVFIKFSKNPIYFIEITAFYLIITGLILHNL
jgi:hypothetical protein